MKKQTWSNIFYSFLLVMVIILIGLFIKDIHDVQETNIKLDQLQVKLNNCEKSLNNADEVLEGNGLSI